MFLLLLACAGDAQVDDSTQDSVPEGDADTDADADSDADADTDSDTDTDVPESCSAGGFSSDPVQLSLPEHPLGGSWSPSDHLPAESFRYIWRDFSGDGLLDLVIIRNGSTDIGRDHWEVYPSSATGWDNAPVSFSLVAALGYMEYDEDIRSDDDEEWNVDFDMNGDGMQDVLMMGSETDPDVGTSHWLMWPSTSTGFATEATEIPLPTEYAGRLDRPTDSWTLAEMNGDGALDLVVLSGLGDGQGTTHWLVHLRDGAGFGAAIVWSLPDYGNAAFRGGASDPDFVLEDMNADGRADLVVYNSDEDSEIGDTHWAQSINNGAGFDAETRYSLEVEGVDLVMRYGTTGVGSAVAGWRADVDGDALADAIIKLDVNDATVGVDSWQAWTGTALGYSGASTEIGLPTWHYPGVDWTGRGDFRPEVMDLDGDGVSELVPLSDPADSGLLKDHLVMHPWCQ